MLGRRARSYPTRRCLRGCHPLRSTGSSRDRLAAGEDLYTLDEGALRALEPDVVVTQDLCAVCAVDVTAVDDALAYLGCAADVVTVDPMSLSEVIESTRSGGTRGAVEVPIVGARLS